MKPPGPPSVVPHLAAVHQGETAVEAGEAQQPAHRGRAGHDRHPTAAGADPTVGGQQPGRRRRSSRRRSRPGGRGPPRRRRRRPGRSAARRRARGGRPGRSRPRAGSRSGPRPGRRAAEERFVEPCLAVAHGRSSSPRERFGGCSTGSCRKPTRGAERAVARPRLGVAALGNQPRRVTIASSSPATPTVEIRPIASFSSSASCRWPAAWRPLRAPRRAVRRHPPGRVHRPHQGDRRLRRRARPSVLLVRGARHRGGDQAPLPRPHVVGPRRTRPPGPRDRRGPGRRRTQERASAQADRRGDRRAARRRARARRRDAPSQRTPTAPISLDASVRGAEGEAPRRSAHASAPTTTATTVPSIAQRCAGRSVILSPRDPSSCACASSATSPSSRSARTSASARCGLARAAPDPRAHARRQRRRSRLSAGACHRRAAGIARCNVLRRGLRAPRDSPGPLQRAPERARRPRSRRPRARGRPGRGGAGHRRSARSPTARSSSIPSRASSLADEWRGLEAGLVQRVRALAAFVADAYGERRIVEAGVVPAYVIESAEYHEPALAGHDLSGGVCIAGLDIVRDRDGQLPRPRGQRPHALGDRLRRRRARAHRPAAARTRAGAPRRRRRLRAASARRCARPRPPDAPTRSWPC